MHECTLYVLINNSVPTEDRDVDMIIPLKFLKAYILK